MEITEVITTGWDLHLEQKKTSICWNTRMESKQLSTIKLAEVDPTSIQDANYDSRKEWILNKSNRFLCLQSLNERYCDGSGTCFSCKSWFELIFPGVAAQRI